MKLNSIIDAVQALATSQTQPLFQDALRETLAILRWKATDPRESLAEARVNLQAELESVNSLAREFGYGQGELDDDLVGCLRKTLLLARQDSVVCP